MEHAAPEPIGLDSEGSGERPFAHGDLRVEQLPRHLEVRRVLGEGGSSVVYEAFHTRLKVPVAVKVLAVRHPQARRRMLREAELYAMLDDPRIPRVYDVNDLPDGTPFVVMEMVPGKSLEELLLERGALSPALALDITRQVLATLAAVHARGVLHRDVKPANVILNFHDDGSCRVRLVDFGIAKLADPEVEQEAVTQRGALVGTPQYMAPERLQGQEADGSADTYATGVMLYEMLAGAPPFEGASVSAIMVAVLREEPMPLHERMPSVSPDLEALIARAMAREPAQRFPSATAMLQALSTLEREPGREDENSAGVAVSAQGKARRWGKPALFGGALLLAVVAALLCAKLMQPAQAAPALELSPRVTWRPAAPPFMQIVPGEMAAAAAKASPPAEPSPEQIEESLMSTLRSVLPAPQPRQTTIDYAELLPDNPY